MKLKSIWCCIPRDQAYRLFSTKRASFVENTKVVRTKEVKFPPKYPVMTAKSANSSKSQRFEYLLVLDFEATCQENHMGPIQPVQEIIEFPVVQLCTKTWTEVRRFHEYVKPTENRRLTSFCTSLTGIIQEMVDEKPNLNEILVKFDSWLKEDSSLIIEDLPGKQNFAFATCGDWDLKVALPNEAKFKNIDVPNYFKEWINVKKAYARHTGHFARGMPELLRIYSLQLVGRHHSGIDDVANICEIVKCLGKDGHNYIITGSNVPAQTTRKFRDSKNLV